MHARHLGIAAALSIAAFSLAGCVAYPENDGYAYPVTYPVYPDYWGPVWGGGVFFDDFCCFDHFHHRGFIRRDGFVHRDGFFRHDGFVHRDGFFRRGGTAMGGTSMGGHVGGFRSGGFHR